MGCKKDVTSKEKRDIVKVIKLMGEEALKSAKSVCNQRKKS